MGARPLVRQSSPLTDSSPRGRSLAPRRQPRCQAALLRPPRSSHVSVHPAPALHSNAARPGVRRGHERANPGKRTQRPPGRVDPGTTESHPGTTESQLATIRITPEHPGTAESRHRGTARRQSPSASRSRPRTGRSPRGVNSPRGSVAAAAQEGRDVQIITARRICWCRRTL